MFIKCDDSGPVDGNVVMKSRKSWSTETSCCSICLIFDRWFGCVLPNRLSNIKEFESSGIKFRDLQILRDLVLKRVIAKWIAVSFSLQHQWHNEIIRATFLRSGNLYLENCISGIMTSFIKYFKKERVAHDHNYAEGNVHRETGMSR